MVTVIGWILVIASIAILTLLAAAPLWVTRRENCTCEECHPKG